MIINDTRKINELESRFRKATTNTNLTEPSFLKTNDNNVEIKFNIKNENGYNITFKKRFSELEELEKFVELLENLKLISQSKIHQVQLIPISNPECSSFNIYIDNNPVSEDTISYYSQYSVLKVKETLRNKIFPNLETITSEVSSLYLQINDIQQNIDSCVDIINHFKSLQTPKEQTKAAKNIRPISKTDGKLKEYQYYKIDLDHILDISKKYIEAYYRNDRNAQQKYKEELKEEYNKIILAIKNEYTIETNYYDIEDKLSLDDMQILIGFIENLENIFKNMKLNAITILEYKQNKFVYYQELINAAIEQKKKEDIVEIIKSISTDEFDKPIEYQITFPDITFPKSANYDQGKFNMNTQMTNNDNVFKDIQIQQLEKLTQEERDSLIYYKSIVYRPINAIIVYLRKQNISFEEATKDQDIFKEILNIISNYYDEFIYRTQLTQENNSLSQQPKAVQRLFGIFNNATPNKAEYTDIVLSSIPNLESALSKIETTEDITVFRGSRLDIMDDERFLSTTLSPYVANDFLNAQERPTKLNYTNLIKIVIPKGSPLIAFTDDLFTDRYKEDRTFNEEQQEILIDPKNFTFKQDYINSYTTKEGINIRIISYQAIPKKQEQETSYSK